MITKPVFTLMYVYGMNREEARRCWFILHKKRLYDKDKRYLCDNGIPYFWDKRCGTLRMLDKYFQEIQKRYGKDRKRKVGKIFHPVLRFFNRMKLWN